MTNIITKFICVSEEVELSKADLDNKFLVLESNHIDGYYTNVPQEKRSPLGHHYFLIAKNNIHCFQDRVIRSVSFYQKDHKRKLHVYPGHMLLHGKEHSFIRIRQGELEEVLGMLSYFKYRKIEFMKTKKFNSTKTLIKFKQMVSMEEIKPNIYRDSSAPHIFFLPIGIDIEYPVFDRMISFIRNNCDFKHFEASLVYSVSPDYEIEDYAKIYSPSCEEGRLEEFDDYFAKAAKEFDVLS